MSHMLFFETITQPRNSVYFLPIILVIIMVAILGLMVGIVSTIKNTGISITDREIEIKSFLYGRKIPIEDVLIYEIQNINLKQNPEYRISRRLNGIGLPNFYSGWMRLKNGEKALVFLTNKDNVLLLPTKDFIVLFSMEKIDELITAIKDISHDYRH